MTLKEISRAATVAWCPSNRHNNLIAMGSLGGLEGVLEFASFNLSQPDRDMNVEHTLKTESCFQCLAWGELGIDSGHYPKGVLAGGMRNGSVMVWNPEAMMSQDG